MTTQKRNAFTLIETVVASAVLALFMTGLYQIVALGFPLWDEGQKKIDEQQNVRIAVNHIARELRTAHSWDIGGIGPSSFPDNTIEMKIPIVGEGAEPYRSISYYFNGGNILRNVDGAGHNVVAYGIQTLRFLGDSEQHLVTIEIVGESGFAVSTSVFLRVDKSFRFIE